MSNQYYFFGTRTFFIRAVPKIFGRVNGALDFVVKLCARYNLDNFAEVQYNMVITLLLR